MAHPYRAYSLTAPATEPVTTAEAKTHLRVDVSTEDTYIGTLVTAARQWVELYTGRICVTVTVTEKWDSFPTCGNVLGVYYVSNPMELRYSPVSAVTSIQYTDTAAATQTWSNTKYVADIVSQPARVLPKNGEVYPSTLAQAQAVTVTYSAGYADAASVPAAIKQAILLMVGDMYENREDSIKRLPTAVEYLLQPYRVWNF